MDITPIDEERLERCVELAEEALFAGDDPFGSVLTDGTGVVLAEAGGPPGGGPSAAVAEVSADVVASVRERNPSLVNRRYAVVPLPGA